MPVEIEIRVRFVAISVVGSMLASSGHELSHTMHPRAITHVHGTAVCGLHTCCPAHCPHTSVGGACGRLPGFFPYAFEYAWHCWKRDFLLVIMPPLSCCRVSLSRDMCTAFRASSSGARRRTTAPAAASRSEGSSRRYPLQRLRRRTHARR